MFLPQLGKPRRRPSPRPLAGGHLCPAQRRGQWPGEPHIVRHLVYTRGGQVRGRGMQGRRGAGGWGERGRPLPTPHSARLRTPPSRQGPPHSPTARGAGGEGPGREPWMGDPPARDPLGRTPAQTRRPAAGRVCVRVRVRARVCACVRVCLPVCAGHGGGGLVLVGVQFGTHLARRKVIYEVKVLNEATSWSPDPAL